MESSSANLPPANKKIDAFNAQWQIDNQEQTLKRNTGYLKAYILSIFLPPVGIYYFIKYIFFGDKSNENRRAGIWSLILTIVSIMLSIWTMQLFFQQVIPPKSQNMEILKELITPENQKSIQKLFQ